MPDRVETKRRSRRRIFLVVAASLAVVALLWLLIPSPIDSVAYRAPAGQGLKGPFQPNTALRSARVVGEGELLGAEDVAVDPQGRLYTGIADGRVMRVTLRPGGGDLLETYAETGGRPLGVRFGPDHQTLFVADADKLAKLPRFLWPKPDPYGFVFEVDAAGHILRSLQDPGGHRVRAITSVEPWGTRLYLGSLYGPIAVWSPPKAP